MPSIPPIPLGLHFCEGLDLVVETGQFSLRGLFQQLRVEVFPSEPVAMTVFASVTDGRGEGDLLLDVLELQETEPPVLIYRQRRGAKFNDPMAIYSLEFRLTRLQFLRPGEHLIQLSFDGQMIADRRLFVGAEGPS